MRGGEQVSSFSGALCRTSSVFLHHMLSPLIVFQIDPFLSHKLASLDISYLQVFVFHIFFLSCACPELFVLSLSLREVWGQLGHSSPLQLLHQFISVHSRIRSWLRQTQPETRQAFTLYLLNLFMQMCSYCNFVPSWVAASTTHCKLHVQHEGQRCQEAKSRAAVLRELCCFIDWHDEQKPVRICGFVLNQTDNLDK